MMDAVLLGVDLGTSGVKVLAVTPEGRVAGRGAGTYEIDWVQEGWAEQDAEAWWNATVGATREALAEAEAERVLAVGLSGQVNGVVVLDAGGRVLRPPIIWLDQRASAEAEEINRLAEDILPRTALGPAAPIHTGAKLRWLLRHDGRMRAAWKALAPKDFLTYRLTGRAVTEVTDAGASLLLDLRRRQWAGELLERVGVPGDLLPEVVESPSVVGEVLPGPAEALGIPVGTPVVAGAGDMAAITAGTGAISPGMGCLMIGTAGQIALGAAGLPERCPPGVWAMTAPVPGAYFWHGLVMTAGYCLTWLARVLTSPAGDGGDTAIGALIEEAAASPPGSHGLLFFPFLDGAATPYADPLARAGFFGASSTHTRADLVRAVMEGVAYNFRDAFEVFASLGDRAARVRIGGGGSRSPLWQTIVADVLSTSLDVLEELEASALGAAVIAGVGAGIFPDFPTACSALVHLRRSVSPDPRRQQIYAETYAAYRQVYDRVREFSPVLTRLGARTGNVSIQGGGVS